MWFAQNQLLCTLQSVPNAAASLVTKLHATSASTDFQFLTIFYGAFVYSNAPGCSILSRWSFS